VGWIGMSAVEEMLTKLHPQTHHLTTFHVARVGAAGTAGAQLEVVSCLVVLHGFGQHPASDV
jgi:hypothetical protein